MEKGLSWSHRGPSEVVCSSIVTPNRHRYFVFFAGFVLVNVAAFPFSPWDTLQPTSLPPSNVGARRSVCTDISGFISDGRIAIARTKESASPPIALSNGQSKRGGFISPDDASCWSYYICSAVARIRFISCASSGAPRQLVSTVHFLEDRGSP